MKTIMSFLAYNPYNTYVKKININALALIKFIILPKIYPSLVI